MDPDVRLFSSALHTWARDNVEGVNERAEIRRVIQFSNLIPMRVNARSGWAAKRRHAAAMLE